MGWRMRGGLLISVSITESSFDMLSLFQDSSHIGILILIFLFKSTNQNVSAILFALLFPNQYR